MRLLFMMFIMCLILSACGNDMNIKKDDAAKIDVAECRLPLEFNSKEDLIKTVKAPRPEGSVDYYEIDHMTYFFEPEAVPEPFKLHDIMVRDIYCTFHYRVADREMSDEPFIDFVWWRDKKASNLQSTLDSSCGGGNTYQQYEEDGRTYFIQKVSNATYADPPEPQYKDVCYMVFWSQFDMIFQANVPPDFTYEEISNFCKAKRISVYE